MKSHDKLSWASDTNCNLDTVKPDAV
jgi:hypothetical protein